MSEHEDRTRKLRAAAIDGAELALLRRSLQDALNEVAKLRRAITNYRDRPGCNPSSRAFAMRKLLWAAGERPT